MLESSLIALMVYEMKRLFPRLRDRRLWAGVINAPARLVVLFISFGVILGLLPSAQARPLHPVPRRAHDRTIIATNVSKDPHVFCPEGA